MDSEPVGVRIVDGNKLLLAVHKPAQECDVPGEPVELGNYQRGTSCSAVLKRLGQPGSVGVFARLDFNVLLQHNSSLTLSVVGNSLALSVQAEAALALSLCAHSNVGHKVFLFGWLAHCLGSWCVFVS